MKSENFFIDRVRAKKSLETLFDIFSKISNHADEVFTKDALIKMLSLDVQQSLSAKINII